VSEQQNMQPSAAYEVEKVAYLLNQTADFNLFGLVNPEHLSVPVFAPDNPNALIGLHVNEVPHRFVVTVPPPTQDRGLRATNVVGEVIAYLSLRWVPVPEDFQAGPHREPPPTPLDPSRSQRFNILDIVVDFGNGNSHTAFGSGRTYPAIEGGRPVVRVASIAVILEGSGMFRGKTGVYLQQGYIEPGKDLFINYLARIPDLEHSFSTDAAFPPPEAILPYPDPEAVFVAFHGEPDPDHPVQHYTSPDGQIVGTTVHELLRIIDTDCATGRQSVRTKTTQGPIVGRLSATLFFDPTDPAAPGTPENPIPWRTENTTFEFFDRRETRLGTLVANVTEGRAFATPLPGAPGPVFQLGGFGPIVSGTGQFAGAEGTMAVNSLRSVTPAALSDLYLLRIYDPDRKFRALVD
jgi:hypothetical protein